MYIRVSINLHKLARRLRNRKWMHVKQLAEEIGISTRTAGKVLAALEKTRIRRETKQWSIQGKDR